MAWTINFRGAQLNSEDVAMAHVTVVNQALETDTWEVVNPLASPSTLCVWVAVAVAEQSGKELMPCLVLVQQAPWEEVVSSYSEREVEAETSGSDSPAESPPPSPEEVAVPVEPPVALWPTEDSDPRQKAQEQRLEREAGLRRIARDPKTEQAADPRAIQRPTGGVTPNVTGIAVSPEDRKAWLNKLGMTPD